MVKRFLSESTKVYFLSLLLYVVSCINLTLVTKTTGYWMKDQGFDIASNTFITSILHLPYSFRLFFTPWLEFLPFPSIGNWGHRKSLIVYMNCVSIMLVILLGFTDITNFGMFFALAFACSIISTATENLNTTYFLNTYSEKVKINWVQGGQMGYTIAVYIATTIYLYLSQFISWRMLYILSSVISVIALIPLIYAKNCQFERLTKPSIDKLYISPIKQLYSKHKGYFGKLTVFSLFYRAPDKIIAPVLALLMIDVFGKNWLVLLKTLALLATFIGSISLSYFTKSERNPILRLVKISAIHIANILVFAGFVGLHVFMIDSAVLLIVLGCSYLLVKIARTIESAGLFSFQCSLFDKVNFNAQNSIAMLADKGFGDILGSISGGISCSIGYRNFLVLACLSVLPAWMVSRRLSRSFDNAD